MSFSDLQLLRPKPRRPFELHSPLLSSSNEFNEPPSRESLLDLTSSTLVGIYEDTDYEGTGYKDNDYGDTGYETDREGLSSPWDADTEIPLRQSFLNLTAASLLGILPDTGYESDREASSTSWGTGAETPSTPWGADAESPIQSKPSSPYRRNAVPLLPTPSTPTIILSLALRSILLFGLGMLYGLLVRHLRDDRRLTPFQVGGIIKPSYDWKYLMFWGAAGLGLGSLLPWVDTVWGERIQGTSIQSRKEGMESPAERTDSPDTNTLGADWIPVVRSVGAFVGIAYAIRKLPWASTMQASLTLFLANPVLWYIIDRSKPGFILSASVGATGTALLLISNPNMLPIPASPPFNSTIGQHLLSDLGLSGGSPASRESIEGGIWILSVLFCSCVCFGNIGRRLALNRVMEQVIGGKETKRRQVPGN